MPRKGELTIAQYAALERIWGEVQAASERGQFGSRGDLLVALAAKVVEELPFLADDAREVQAAVAVGRAHYLMALAKEEQGRDALGPMRYRAAVLKWRAAVVAYGKRVEAEAIARDELGQFREHKGEVSDGTPPPAREG